jgi:hypothetical protein
MAIPLSERLLVTRLYTEAAFWFRPTQVFRSPTEKVRDASLAAVHQASIQTNGAARRRPHPLPVKSAVPSYWLILSRESRGFAGLAE